MSDDSRARARQDFLVKRDQASRTRPTDAGSDPLANLGNPFGATNNSTPTANPFQNPPSAAQQPEQRFEETSTAAVGGDRRLLIPSNVTQSRREDLLHLARKERDEFLDDFVEASPEVEPVRSIHEKTSSAAATTTITTTTITTTPSSSAPPPYSQLAATPTSSSSMISSEISQEESRASFLQTAQRMFSFLNRFSGDEVGPNGELKMPDFQPPPPHSSSSNNNETSRVEKDSGSGSGKDGTPPKKQFNYKAFKEKIKNPHAGEAFKRIKRFVVDFGKSANYNASDPPSRGDSGLKMRTFLDEVERLMSVNELWCHDDPEEWDNTCEGLEKFVTSKLYEHIFCPRDEDRERDRELEERISSLSFVSFQHLDINGPETKDEFLLTWRLAQDELGKMNDYKAPRDKMVCMLNACKVIVRLLSEASEDAGASPPGADQFLPALIYVVLKSNPPNLFSNLDYIDRFRNPNKMISEPGYWYTNLYSAVTFLENVQHDSLTISEEEFALGMKDAKLQMAEAKEMASEMASEMARNSSTKEDGEEGVRRAATSDLESVFVHSSASSSSSSKMGRAGRAGSMGSVGSAETKSMQATATSMESEKVKRSLERARRWVGTEPPLQPPLPLSEGSGTTVVSWKAIRYRYLARSLNEVRVTDVGPLLDEYKNLAATTDRLLREREEMIARINELESSKRR